MFTKYDFIKCVQGEYNKLSLNRVGPTGKLFDTGL